jgi:hypothetical protein
LFDAHDYGVLGTRGFSGFADQVTSASLPSAPAGAVFDWDDVDIEGGAHAPPSNPGSSAVVDDASNRQTPLALGIAM